MIQTNELRIGNIAKDRGGKILKIDRFYGNKIECDIKGMPDKDPDTGIKLYYHPLTEEIQFLEPIPLTEDWLLKFGFETWHKRDWDIGGVGDGQLLTVTTYAKTPIVRVWNQDIIHIKYVHQLQNLYFALTGTELEFK